MFDVALLLGLGVTKAASSYIVITDNSNTSNPYLPLIPMKPVVAKSWEADYLATPPPYERHRQVLISKKENGLSSASICSVTIPAGSKSDSHMHEVSDEIWLVTSGRGKVIVDEHEVEVEPGSVVCAPAGSKHQILNTSKEVLHAYIVFAPAGPEEALLKMMGKR